MFVARVIDARKQAVISLHIHSKSITRARQAKSLYDAHLLDSTNSFTNKILTFVPQWNRDSFSLTREH